MKYLPLLLAAAGLAVASPAGSGKFTLSARQDPDDLLIFPCDQMVDVCHNMCYGAYCLGVGTELMFDTPSASDKRNRRKAAGCIDSGGNRCSTKKGYASGFNCDEYPFASTVPTSGVADRVNRCVPSVENSRQGGYINAFYRGAFCNGGPCTFNVEFSNAGNIDMCDAVDDPSQCDDDDNEVIGPGDGTPAQDGDEADDGTDDDGGNPEPEGKKKRTSTTRHRYLTSSGVEINIRGGRVGQRTIIVLPRNATLWDEQTNNHVFDPDDEAGEYDYMLETTTMWKRDTPFTPYAALSDTHTPSAMVSVTP